MSELPPALEISGRKQKTKKYLRVDMTPMVDLGFLLITFFILTASMMEPSAMKLNMPDPDGLPQPVPKSVSLTLVLKDSGKVYYYERELTANTIFKRASLYSLPYIRDILLDKKKRTEAQQPPFNNMVVIIKPSPETSYKEIVDILDEMVINDIKRYIITEPEPLEYTLIQPAEKG